MKKILKALSFVLLLIYFLLSINLASSHPSDREIGQSLAIIGLAFFILIQSLIIKFKTKKINKRIKEKDATEARIKSLKIYLRDVEQSISDQQNQLTELKENHRLQMEKYKHEEDKKLLEIHSLAEKYKQENDATNIKIQTRYKQEEDRINKLIQSLIEKYEKEAIRTNRQIQSLTDKISQRRDLYDAMERGIESYYVSPDFEALTEEQKATVDSIAPTVLLNLNCYNYQELKKKFDANQKQVKELIDNFQNSNLNKSNRILYQIMAIALSAELQNILIKLKYGKRDDARSDIKILISNYIAILSDGSQNIPVSVKKFLFALEELYLNAIDIEYEYYIKKEQARQEQLELKAQMKAEKEELRRLKEEEEKIEREKEKFRLEQERLEAMLLEAKTEEEKKSIEVNLESISTQISDIDKKHEEVVNLQNGKAGNVYIISNIGSFGENIFKVGMTRRLDPQERVDELGDASVPFKFDVHSFIFSKNAPELETELHRLLDDRRVNKVNLRKEFFHVSLDEIEQLVYKVHPNAEFNRTILASEYRQSLSMK